jgi:hypothetical protein
MRRRGRLTSPARQSPLPVIGFLNGAAPDGFAATVTAFDEGLV